MAWFEGFEARKVAVNGIEVFARTGGTKGKPVLLMLHGFPETHALWHRVAQRLAHRFELVLPDLRGYGDSSKPPGDADHGNYSKRTMAKDMSELMAHLGHERYGVVGHDRGGRVAHRLAVDHPDRVTKLCVIDIAPTLDMYEATNMAFATAYYHWFHMIQPAPGPERMIGCDVTYFLDSRLGGMASPGVLLVEPEALAEYHRCFSQPESIHGGCEDYRAAAGIDLEHDRASRAAGLKIRCDLLALWGERGVVGKLFDPVKLWSAQCAGKMQGVAMPAGHFIPEERPEETAAQLLAFF